MDSRILLCGHCGPRRALLSCTACGLPLCPECRVEGRCPACARALAARRRRWRRRALWLTLGLGSTLALTVLAVTALEALLVRPLTAKRCCGRYGTSPAAGRLQLANLQIALEHDVLERGACPDSLQALYTRGLLARRPLDPWGTPPDYRCLAGGKVQLTSAGPDRTFHTEDDLRLAFDLDLPAAAPPRRTDDPVPVTQPAALGPVTVSAPPLPSNVVPRRLVERVGEGSYLIDRRGIERALLRVPWPRGRARVVPLRRGGCWSGVRLLGFGSDSVYGRLGLRSGDVVKRVNGVVLDSPQRALEIYARGRTAGRFEVQLSRRGRPLIQHYRIIDG